MSFISEFHLGYSRGLRECYQLYTDFSPDRLKGATLGCRLAGKGGFHCPRPTWTFNASDNYYRFAFVVSFAVLIEGVGLYPPRGGPILDDQSYYLANGSLAQYPLDNYQYPRMRTVDILDMDSIWQAHPSVNAARLCRKYPAVRA